MTFFSIGSRSLQVRLRELFFCVKFSSSEKKQVFLMQKPVLSNECEAVSLAIVLKYAGFSVDPVTLYDQFVPKFPFKTVIR